MQNGLSEMGGSDKVDVVRALGNELVVNLLEAGNGNFLAETLAADVVVLAKDAVQIAAGKENCAAATGAADYRLFPHMQAGTGNDGRKTDAAAAKAAFGTGYALRSVNTAAVRTNIT